MQASKLFFPTLREVPAEAETTSHRLLLRGAFIRNTAAGVYSYLPLGYRVIKKIEQIVREELDASGAQELLMPAMVSAELWRESGRWDVDVLFKLKDGSGRNYGLGMTHEEVVTDLLRGELRSYRELPLNLYQIQTKFRDEPRPRGGLIRAREFIMLDAYSFDKDRNDLDRVYQKMYDTFSRIFARCGLDVLPVEAETGVIGGSESCEFMVITPAGEDTVLKCSSCGYAANVERCAIGISEEKPAPTEEKPLETVETPGKKTVDEVTAFLGVRAKDLVKTLVYLADGKPVAALVRGDRELNEAKLSRLLGAQKLELADPETIMRLTGAEVGFAGPVGLKGAEIISDNEIASMRNFVTGANKTDAHYLNVNPGRDFKPGRYADLRVASDGDPCPGCGGRLEAVRAVEAGHIFKLETKYSAAMDATFRDENGQDLPIMMGCYGLGISRLAAVIVETSNDQDGIIWPANIAPFDVVIIIVNPDDETNMTAGLSVYEDLRAMGIDVLIDERDMRSGAKFKDADLLGIPVQIVAGRTTYEGKVELRLRRSREEKRQVDVAGAADEAAALARSEKRALNESADRVAPKGE